MLARTDAIAADIADLDAKIEELIPLSPKRWIGLT
jgi:hypothetical protein